MFALSHAEHAIVLPVDKLQYTRIYIKPCKMKTLSNFSILHYFTLHLFQVVLVNYSSAHPASVSMWTDKGNLPLDWSWCLHWENELQSCWNAKNPLKAAIKLLTQILRMFNCCTQVGKIRADCTSSERLFGVQLSAVFLGNGKQAFRPSHSRLHSECRLLYILPWHCL